MSDIDIEYKIVNEIKDELAFPPAQTSVIVEYLNRHGWLRDPDQAPGRPITRSEFNKAFSEWFDERDKARIVGIVERLFGITVIPDPEPTNAELIERKLRELREEPGEWMTYATDSDICGFARALDAKGVKAPGGDDDH